MMRQRRQKIGEKETQRVIAMFFTITPIQKSTHALIMEYKMRKKQQRQQQQREEQ